MIIYQGNICYPFSIQEIVYDRFWLSPFYALRITTVFLIYPSELWPSSALGINYRLNFERHFSAVCGVVRSGKATFSLVHVKGLEPPIPHGHMDLSHMCIPFHHTCIFGASFRTRTETPFGNGTWSHRVCQFHQWSIYNLLLYPSNPSV